MLDNKEKSLPRRGKLFSVIGIKKQILDANNCTNYAKGKRIIKI
jgi:hypothetical protein